MNVKTIMCPVDYSESGDAAIAYAVSLAKDYGSELHLVHVYEPATVMADGGFGSAVLPPVSAEDLQVQEEKLASVRPDSSIKSCHKLLLGNPTDELVRYAKEAKCDLVVMGTHGRTGLGRLLMGSVAEGVLRRAPCPVLTVRQPSPESQ